MELLKDRRAKIHAPSLKSVTHPTLVKLGTVGKLGTVAYLKKIQKINKSRSTSSADIRIVSPETSNNFHYVKKYNYSFQFSL